MTDASTVIPESDADDSPNFPMPRVNRCPFDPAPALQELQAKEPISRVRLWDGSTPWLVTHYADLRALYSDPRLSVDKTDPHYPHEGAAHKERRHEHQMFLFWNDPEHAAQRRMVTAPFTIKRVEAMRPAIQKIVDGLIDDMLAGPKPADLVEAFALPVPSLVICELLGVPYEQHAAFQADSRAIMTRGTPPQEGLEATQRLTDVMDRLIGEKIAKPGNDLLSELAAKVTSGEVTRSEAATLGVVMLIAGHETTGNMIALGTLALLQHPDQLAIMRDADDPKVVAGAVEELLRYLTIVGARRRFAVADIEVAGQVIHAGDGVIMAQEAGDRDPAAFPDPGRLDLLRGARNHIAFGYGPHQCLGQPLARVELQVVYPTLLRRFPGLRLAADLDQIPLKNDTTAYGVYELPVIW
jgi:cytochrome P450